MAFKWVNPGYGELFDLQTAPTYIKNDKTPYVGLQRSCKVSIPSLKELYIKCTIFDVKGYSDRIGTIGVHYAEYDNSKKTIYIEYYNSTITLYVNSVKIVEIQTDKLSKKDISLKIKTGSEDGFVTIYLDGTPKYTYTGNVGDNEDIKALYAYGNSSTGLQDFIIADYDILNEKVAEVSLKDISGTWEGITDGAPKVTDVNQTLSQKIDVDALKKAITTGDTTPTITSVALSAYNIQYPPDKVNALTAEMTQGTTRVFSNTAKINSTNTLTPQVYIKNISVDSLENMTLNLKSAKV